MDYMHEEPLQCGACYETFTSPETLKAHFGVCTGMVENYKCRFCLEIFLFESDCNDHISMCHNSTTFGLQHGGNAHRIRRNLKIHRESPATAKEPLEPSPTPEPEIGYLNADLIVRQGWKRAWLIQRLHRPKKVSWWTSRIKDGTMIKQFSLKHKMDMLEKEIEKNPQIRFVKDVFEAAKNISMELFNCPICKFPFDFKKDCWEHCQEDHPNSWRKLAHFCENCFRSFEDGNALQKHIKVHEDVKRFLETRASPVHVDVLVPIDEQLDKLIADHLPIQRRQQNQRRQTGEANDPIHL